MRLNRTAFQRATGYQLLQQNEKTAQVRVPGQQKPVALPYAALEQLQRSYETIMGPGGAMPLPAADVPRAARKTLTEVRADLNTSLFDGSPLTVTDAEVNSAHNTLMRSAPGAFAEVLKSIPDAMLNRYLTGLADADAFRVDGGTPKLAEFAAKVALELDPGVGQALVGRLSQAAQMRLLEGALAMPSGQMLRELRTTLGTEGWTQLVKGSKPDSLVGRGLLDGRFFDVNVTDDFKTKYAAAQTGNLPLPAGAKDTVFMGGPGLLGAQLPGYLEPNFRALEQWGVPAENTIKLNYNTASSPQENADLIFAQIKAQHDAGKRVVVLGHSKFGRDMLEAFARHPELKDMVDGTLMMQPALTAQVAKDLARPEMHKLLNPVLDIVGGDRESFNGLSENFEDLPPWPSDMPTVVMASSTESPKALLKPVSEHYYGHFYGAASDGLVALQDQVSLEGAAVVTLPGLADHAQPGLKFKDLTVHFAVQIEAGAPDDVVTGMLDRLRTMAPSPLIDGVVLLARKHMNTPQERARLAQRLREVGPALDHFAKSVGRAAGYPLVDNEPMTQALVAQLFERMNA